MRRGQKNKNGRQFVCHKCGARPPWDAVENHRKKCHKTVTRRHRKEN